MSVEQIGFVEVGTQEFKRLISDGFPVQDSTCTIVSGQNLAVGTVLGTLTKTVIAAVADEGNTGDGAVSGLSIKPKAIPGVYTLTCITEASNAGTFILRSPEGFEIGTVAVGTPYVGEHLNVTVADGANDFDIGDVIEITVSGSGKMKAYDADNTDGSEMATGVLARATNATAGDLKSWYYTTGKFHKSRLIGIDAAAEAQLKKLGIYVVEEVNQ